MSEKRSEIVHQFSRETAKEKRRETAVRILKTRKEQRFRHEQKAEIEGLLELAHGERAKFEVEQLGILQKEIAEFRKRLGELQSSGFSRLKNYFKILSIKKDIVGLEEGEKLKVQKLAEMTEKETDLLDKLQEIKTAEGLAESGQDILFDFYESEQKRWQTSEVEWKDIDRYFSAEHLASLSLDEYVVLLRRFPQEMVTHVSRRGIRDHGELTEHDTGKGEFQDGFDNVLASKRLQSAIGIKLEQAEVDKYVAGELGLSASDTRETAENKLQKVVGARGWASFADFSAVHFAAEMVADDYYGSERGNECFVVFPSAMIAAEYDFGGHYTDISGKKEVDRERDDVWVWAKEEKGVPLDAGIVFLPKSARVNPETGSRYELDGDRSPSVDSEAVAIIDRLVGDENFLGLFEEFVNKDMERIRVQAHREVGQEPETRWQSFKEKEDFFDEKFALLEAELIAVLSERLAQEFGITDKRLQKRFFHKDRSMLLPLLREAAEKPSSRGLYEFVRNTFLQNAGMLYKETIESIPAQEFWQKYFEDHPDRRPSKVVFYEGNDPTVALRKWRQENGIVRTSSELGIDFESRAVDTTQKPWGTKTRFEAVAREAIDDHLARAASVPSIVTRPADTRQREAGSHLII